MKMTLRRMTMRTIAAMMCRAGWYAGGDGVWWLRRWGSVCVDHYDDCDVGVHGCDDDQHRGCDNDGDSVEGCGW